MSKLRLLILFGGVSSEHDISCISAASVVENIDPALYEIIKIGITKNGRWLYYPGEPEQMRTGQWQQSTDTVSAFLSPDKAVGGIFKADKNTYTFQKIDVAFAVLHGKNGEDGTVQGLLTLAGIPFVGCKVLSSAVCMDKCVTNTLLLANNIPHCRYECINKRDLDNLPQIVEGIIERLCLPLFVKPANAGSSVGISKAKTQDELYRAIMHAATHDNKILIEECVVGQEVECAVLGEDPPIASVLGEVESTAEFYDYNAKYNSGTGGLYIPARVDCETAEKIKKLAIKAFLALDCSGFARIDFFVRKSDGAVLLNEINTIPGFTPISMFPRLMQATGIEYSELIDRLIKLALGN